jgi:hypothetical protein
MEKGLGLGFFIAISITAMTLVQLFSESTNVPARGEFESGFKELALKNKLEGDDIKMSAFYPVRKRGRFEKKPEKPDWCPNEAHTLNGMFVGGKFSKKVFDFLRYSKINAYVNEPLSEEVKGKKIPVMIFSHGVRGHRNFCSGVC